MGIHEKIFTADGNWTCPAGVKRIEVEGCGGGGGGGGGYYTTNSTNLWLNGGSGGGGARLSKVFVAVTPGVTYDVTVGTGGAGSAAVLSSTNKATDGGDSIFKISGGATLATFTGAGGGYSGAGTTGSQLYYYRLGGQHTKFGSEEDVYSIIWLINTGDIVNYIVRPGIEPNRGGFSVGTNDTSMGSSSYGGPADVVFGAAASFRGGAPGSDGTDSGTYRGGSGGGGGGAGAYGPGGAGGNGGNANGSGQGAFGIPGSSAAANSGAGGGGGGAPGCGSSNVGVAAAGGNGGSGKVIIRWTT